jgi:hypothetical protein
MATATNGQCHFFFIFSDKFSMGTLIFGVQWGEGGHIAIVADRRARKILNPVPDTIDSIDLLRLRKQLHITPSAGI